MRCWWCANTSCRSLGRNDPLLETSKLVQGLRVFSPVTSWGFSESPSLWILHPGRARWLRTCRHAVRGKSVVAIVGGCFLVLSFEKEQLESRISAIRIEVPTAEIAFVAGSGQELVRQMIKEGPSLEEKTGVALPVSDVSAYFRYGCVWK